jgi:hypothetical protein
MTNQDEQPTAKARLKVVVTPNGPQGETEVQVPGGEARRLISSFERLALGVLAVGLVIGTLCAASSAHIPPMAVVGLVAGELLLTAGTALTIGYWHLKRP